MENRPWRKVGLGICVLLAVMFVVGDAVFDVATAVRRPILFTVYWLVVVVLVAWLCTLAAHDVSYTRKMIGVWKKEHQGRDDES